MGGGTRVWVWGVWDARGVPKLLKAHIATRLARLIASFLLECHLLSRLIWTPNRMPNLSAYTDSD